jgi:protein disulfide-isomerase A4
MTKITLYHANWCGHCKRFMPTWNALKDVFSKNNIQYEEYEDTENEIEVQNAGVEGFPTIRITNDTGEEYDYNGDRSADGILNEVLPNLQMGGSKLNKYKIRYTIN